MIRLCRYKCEQWCVVTSWSMKFISRSISIGWLAGVGRSRSHIARRSLYISDTVTILSWVILGSKTMRMSVLERASATSFWGIAMLAKLLSGTVQNCAAYTCLNTSPPGPWYLQKTVDMHAQDFKSICWDFFIYFMIFLQLFYSEKDRWLDNKDIFQAASH